MNPLKDIVGSEGEGLHGKKICLCVTGSVAAVKVVDVVRKLMRNGADVFCVMSYEAQNIIRPELLEWATGNPVITKLTGRCEHIRLAGEHCGKVDLILVAPATANTLGKAAKGIDDTPVTTVISTAFGSGIPIIFIPAMHSSMYGHPAVKRNIKELRGMGAIVVEPIMVEGKAKFPDAEEILDWCIRLTTEQKFKGRKVLVTAGATREWIDDVRFISNPSSGIMGIAIARWAWRMGAEVVVVMGHVECDIPRYLRVREGTTVKEMMDEVMKELKSSHIVILTAAVGDFIIKKKRGKMAVKKDIALKLKIAPKISDMIKRKKRGVKLIVFKAEYGVGRKELERRAREKMKSSRADIVVANDVSEGIFGQKETNVLIIGKGWKKEIKGDKEGVAREILLSL